MIVLVGVGLTFIVYQLFYIWISESYGEQESPKHPKLYNLLNRKPFNCEFCISLWIAIGFFLSTQLYPSLIIPIAYRLIKKIMNRI